MRIAALGDIHGNLIALETVLADCRSRRAEKYFVLGDLVMKGPRPREVLEIVRQLPGIVIQGNTDWFMGRPLDADYRGKSENEQQLVDILRWGQELITPEDIHYLDNLPKTVVQEINGTRFLLCHGSPRKNMEKLLPETPDNELAEILSGQEEEIILAAHTHIPMVREFADKLIINTGSVGFPLDEDPRASYCLLDIFPDEPVRANIIRVEYDIEKHVTIARDLGFPHVPAYTEGLSTGGSRGLR